MPIVEFTQDDIDRNRIMDVDWYRVRIEKVSEKPSNAGDSVNYWIEGKVLCNATNGDEKYKGMPTPYLFMFNSKAIGKAAPFIEAVQGEPIKTGQRYELKNSEGKVIEMHIGNGLYKGQMQNTVTGMFRKSSVAA